MKKLLFLFLFMAGCSRPSLPTATHIEFRDRVERDSIFVRDSTLVERRQDTVFVTRDRWHSTDRYVRDTVLRRDSIPYPVEVVREVRHVPTLYRYSLWIAIAAILFCVWKLLH